MDNAVFVVAGIAGPDQASSAPIAGIEAKAKETAQHLIRSARTVILKARAR